MTSISKIQEPSHIDSSIHGGYSQHLSAFSIETLLEKRDFLSVKLEQLDLKVL